MPRFYSLRASVRRALAGLFLLSVGALGARAQTVPPGEGLVADAAEVETLRQFYAAYGGAAWITRTNWTQGATLAEAAAWYGVTVAGGDVVGLALPANNLRPVPYPPSLLYQLLGLQRLDLRGNAVDVSFFYGLRNLPNLQELNLSGCQGLALDFASLATCPNLRVARLHNTPLLSGRIGAAVGRLQRLEVLDLGNDDTFPNAQPVSGVLPAELGNCRALRELNLAGTNVAGALPASIGRLTQLEVLDMAYAALDAPLPDSLGYCRALRVLNLPGQNYGSGIGGDLRSLRRLTNLVRVDLSRDGLQGAIPPELANNAALAELRLGSNRLAGAVPAALGGLAQLAVLDLGNNQLAGAVPPALGALPRLTAVTLSYNEFMELPSFRGVTAPAGLRLAVAGNALDFGPLEANFTGAGQHPFGAFAYSPQATPPGTDVVPYVIGGPLQLTRTVGGAHNRYQWERQVGGQWTAVAGATAATLTVPAATPADEGLYRLRITNDWVPNLTLTAKLVSAQARCGPPVLTVSPGATVEAGNSAVLTAGVAAPAAGVTLAWAPAAGLNTATGPRVTATPAATTTYTVTATGRCGTVPTTATATVTVTVLPPPPLANPPVDGCAPALVNAAPAPHVPTPDDAAVNFVRTYAPRVALTDTAAVRQGTKEQVQVKTEYLDGLGRPVQTVLRQESPLGNDLVQPVAYDALGRQPRQYQPYAAPNPAGNAGAYRPNALREQYDFYRQDPATTPAGPGNLAANVAPTGVAYAETAFEPSPLNRVLAQAAPGEAWQLLPAGGHAVRRLERPNTDADAVPRLVPGYEPTPTALACPGDYAAGELWLTETADEHGARTQEFKDKQGLLVAKRVELPTPGATGAANWLNTYYAYDDFPRLRAVVPPRAAVLLAAASPAWTVPPAAEVLLFRYRYDGRGRIIAKQVPGQDGETATVYDQLDRPVLTQDPTQRGRQEWGWTKYDALGRVILSGLLPRTADRETLQAEADAWAQPYEARAAGAAAGYSTDGAYPPLGAGTAFGPGQLLSVAQYDDYDFDNDGTPDAAYDAQSDGQFAAGTAPVADARTTGLPTRTRTRVLGAPEGQPGAWLTTTTFYDDRARPVQVQATNARAGLDLVTTRLDFAGKPLQSVTVHHGPNLPAAGLQVVETMAYDHAGRLLATAQQVPGEAQPTPIAALTYNELGQLTRKTLGTGALTQPVDYRYNVRGWLTHLNDADHPLPGTLFGLALSYDCGFQVPQYTGNLSGQKWRGRDGVERAYGYLYDGASRLRQGDYVARAGGAGSTAGAWSAETQRYALRGVTYDENGNLLALQRRGLWANATRAAPAQFGLVDNLTYTYSGNRLQAVNDAVTANALPRPAGYHGAPTSLAGDFQEGGVRQGTEYYYDANGSLTQDKNKGITAIAYNFLNLPRQIHFGAGADSLVFRYSAAGQKVAKLVYQTGQPLARTDYLGPYQYEDDSLRFFPHAEGRVLRAVSPVSGQVTYQREFTVKDHLGNLRLAYRAGRRLTCTAGLEPSDAARETQQFDSASVSAPVAQNVGGLARTRQYVARLNAGGSAPQPLGPLKQVGVQKGDTVLVTAHGLYPQAVSNTSFLFSFASFVAGLVQPPPAGGPRPDGRRGGLPLLNIGVSAALPALVRPAGGVPVAYVRLLVFNADSTLVSSQTQQLSQAARNNYEGVQVQVIAPQDGYVTAYVANESDADVFFDDVTVEHRQGLQVQETQYDPVGLELAGLSRETPGLKPLNQYRWNGKEFQADLGLNWTHQDWRFFDAQLGRWHVTDPEIENGQESWSPYSFGFDNAVRYADANGREPDGGGPPDPKVYGTISQHQPNLAETVSNINAVMGDIPNTAGISALFGAAYNLVNDAHVYVTGFFDKEKAHTMEGHSVNRNEYQQAGFSTLMLVGSLGMDAAATGAARSGATSAAKTGSAQAGSGPISGVLEVSSNAKSVKAFNNYSPKGGADFVFDHTTNRVAVATKSSSGAGHPGLVKSLGASDANVVGGRLRRTSNGSLQTSEWSGHYGHQWTPEVRTQFIDFMSTQTNRSVEHSGSMNFK